MLLIPRTFHSIWIGGKPLPEAHAKWLATWCECNPGWEHTLWTDETVESGSLQNRELYLRGDITLACRSDILRIELLYRHGGVYVDTDFECFRCIEPLLDGAEQCIGEQMPGECCNAVLGCTKENPSFRVLMELLPQSFVDYDDAHFRVGPKFFDRVLCTLPPFRKIQQEEAFPYLWNESYAGRDAYPDAYAAHHWAGSWNQ
jgi:mannosyltransferase OCH1-like enzyme